MDVNLPPEQEAIYCRAMTALDDANIPYIVSGALAIHHYTGAWRNTKDLDLFLRPEDRDAALTALLRAGFRTEITVPNWLAKAFDGDIMVDLITGFGNWLAPVDDSWIAEAEPADFLGQSVRIISAADLIWPKAYVSGRERFDNADINHLIRRAPDHVNWRRLIHHFGEHWELLLAHLNLYRFAYPEARDHVPSWVMEELNGRLSCDLRRPVQPDLPFRGPLLDRYSYLVDIERWGEPDPREAMAERRDIPIEEVHEVRQEDLEHFENMQPTVSS